MIDTHTHLTSCGGDPDETIARARARGVAQMITIGSSMDEMRAAADLADGDPGIWCTAGLHPHHAASWGAEIETEIRLRARNARCVAIGETGLDWFRARATRDEQLRAFDAQLEIARDLGLPVVIHCRDAEDDCFPVLAEHAPPTVILHCFAATSRLDEAIERGWYCSFAGNVTYPSATALQSAARKVPSGLLLLETDAPYLAPVPHRGRPNEPAFVIDTLNFVAALRGMEPDDLAAVVETNADRAFRLA